MTEKKPKDKQQSLGDFREDEARYRRCSEPHESPAAAQKALDGLFEELAELRVKYRIRDMYVIYNIALTEDDGRDTVGSGVTGFGTQSLFESMAACAYGIEKQKREAQLRKLLTGS